jgi:hemolysin D
VIVPDEGGLVVEALVENKDVGFVHAGQEAEIKIESFNFTRYGISRDTVGEDRGQDTPPKGGEMRGGEDRSQLGSGSPAYIARIALEHAAISTKNGVVDLAPGMAVTAEIKTGRRRVIDYLLSPLVRYRQEGMRER